MIIGSKKNGMIVVDAFVPSGRLVNKANTFVPKIGTKSIVLESDDTVLNNTSIIDTTTVCEEEESPVDLNFMVLKASSSSSFAPPVLFLHGLLGQKRNFATLGSMLASRLDTKRDIYAVDLRNHGDNNKNDWRRNMSYSHMTRDVVSFLNQQNISKVVLVGHSMGGKLAASMALSHPNRVCGIIVLDIAPVRYTTTKDVAWKKVQDIVDCLHTVNLERHRNKRELEVELRESIEDPSIREYILGAVETIILDEGDDSNNPRSLLRWKINVPAIVQQMDVLAGFDVDGYGDMSSISTTEHCHPRYTNGDAFFIHSPISHYIQASHMSILQRYFSNFMIATIRSGDDNDDVGHTMHHESPEETVTLMKQFLDR